ncbi:MBL fold metallo-hydrolase [Salinibacillus xinjiangensis]|uniref:MBL fold metallo-hydrolase n=1 Tax=Salinibacillus xinjiangensis TaxID=1229268 RepID=A0A6G1X7X0_9BACI|nr:MBL fold metallo-hydrolase [Salinibacillus xinjiangensis]MRG87101.1 MBL fold metallo-hydrolase [Salinibacillus xinjiangensis]
MTLTQINDSCYFFDAAVNIGYVHHGDEGLIIDAGIDKSSIKKVIKALQAKSLPITHLFITHAHSDHYGGAYVLEKDFHVDIIAPKFESAIVENPMLEPLYLFGGNDPLKELRNKFLEGKPVKVNHEVDEGEYSFGSFDLHVSILPGHSYYQAGVVIDEVFFAADSYFSEDQLHKHSIPYITDADLTIESLRKAKEVKCVGAVPGHGTYEEDFRDTIQKNIDYHEQLLADLKAYLAEKGSASHEQVVADICESYEVNPSQLSQFLLFRTAVTAYLIGLIKREEIEHRLERARWVFSVN